MNNALKALLEGAKKEGAIKSTENSQNIYQQKYFEGVTNEKEEKKVRRTLREIAINYLQLIASAKDKKEFTTNYAKFEKFFLDTYTEKEVTFSVFENLRKDSAKKILATAKENFAKYNK